MLGGNCALTRAGVTSWAYVSEVFAARAFEECAQLARAGGMPQLAQGLRFDLADALAGHGERLAHLFQGVLGAVVQAEAHFDHFLFARCERLQHRRGLLLQIQIDHRVRRRHHGLVFDEVARCESSSSPIGVSSEMGSCAIFKILRTLATGMSMRLAISSDVGSRPSSCTSWRLVRISLLIVSIMCTGMRMVRAWSAMARVMAWRIHQVA